MMTEPIYENRKVTDLKDLITQSAKLYNKDAFRIKKNGKYTGISYKEYKRDIDALGTALLKMGLKGEKIAVIGENRYEWCTTYLAVTGGVGVIVPLDKELPENEIENLINRSKASAIVFSDKYRSVIEGIREKNKELKYIVDMDLAKDDEGVLSFKELIKKGKELIKKGDKKYINAKIDPESMAALCFTSGTTDLAKGVMLSHKNLVSDVVLSTSVLEILPSDKVLSILPMHHTYECTAGFLVMIYSGACISFCEGLKHISQNLKEVKPTVLLVVPLLLENMYNKIWTTIKKNKMEFKVKAGLAISNTLAKLNIDVKKKLFAQVLENFGGELRVAIAGGAAVDPKVLEGLRGFGISTIQGYGLTESSPIAALNQLNNYRDASIGLPLPEIYIDIFEPDENGIGEIRLKGPTVMMGYYEDEEQTNKVLKDGYFYTGDIGYMDKDGFFYITGRKKNVIITKNGKNVFPEEVELYLNRSPYIVESIVTAREGKDEIEVYAIIVPNTEEIAKELGKEDISKEEIKEIIDKEVKKVNKQMPIYKVVRDFEIRETEFEKTTTKKIKRSANI